MRKNLLSLFIVLLASLVGQLLYGKLAPPNLIMLYLAAVLFSAFLLGRGPAVLASVAGVLAFDFLFVPPRFRLSVEDTQYFVTFAGLLCVGLLISGLVSQLRNRTTAAVSNERKAVALYRMSQELSKGMDVEAIQAILNQAVRSVLRAECALFLESDGRFRQADPYAESVTPDEAAMRWSFQNVRNAGRGTALWPDAKMAYFPVSSGIKALGVIGIQTGLPVVPWTQENRQWTETLANQTAVALERVVLFREAKELELIQEKERFQAILLNSLSHDLRTPLVAITGALSHLASQPGALRDPAGKEMVDNARHEADRLNRLVAQWIDMARAESGNFKTAPSPNDLKDLVGVALKSAEAALGSRVVNVVIPPDFPDIPIDFPLFLKAFSNLLDNAIKYSPPDEPIDITAVEDKTAITLEVADRGQGVPDQYRNRIFEKFFRTPRSTAIPGMGLGLSISRAIIAAHGGEITVHDRPDKGTVFRITLPLQKAADGRR